MTEKTNPQLVGITWRKWTNMTHKKVKNQIVLIRTVLVSVPCFFSIALDYKTGFGGKFGVQNDRMDKSSVGWDHVEKVEKHVSQKGKV